MRVLVPCYREELAIVQRTVLAALDADLPPGSRRLVYLCDDGADAAKRQWAAGLAERGLVYVSGRRRSPGAWWPPRGRPAHAAAGSLRRQGAPRAASLAQPPARCMPVALHPLPAGEINGKSCNLNHCLARVIYPGFCPAGGPPAHQLIPSSEVVVVFDADMVAKPHFFTRILQVRVLRRARGCARWCAGCTACGSAAPLSAAVSCRPAHAPTGA